MDNSRALAVQHPQSLTLQQQGPVFTQMGTVNWTELSKTVVSGSVAVLARLSAAGIDNITAVMALTFLGQLNLGDQGSLRVKTALDQLPSYGSISNIIWFGFGVRHIVRTLTTTQQGCSAVAICATLGFEMGAEDSALALSQFMKLYNGPEELQPSVGQWARLVESCQGIFSKTTYPATVMQYRRMAEKVLRSSRGTLKNRPLKQDRSSTAEILRALVDLSNNRLDSFSVTGDERCVWVAAIGNWLLGFRVGIITSDGEKLVWTCAPGQSAQISITLSTKEEQESQGQVIRVRHIVMTSLTREVARDYVSDTIEWSEAPQCILDEVSMATLLSIPFRKPPNKKGFRWRRRDSTNNSIFNSHSCFGMLLGAVVRPSEVTSFSSAHRSKLISSAKSRFPELMDPFGPSIAAGLKMQIEREKLIEECLSILSTYCLDVNHCAFCRSRGQDLIRTDAARFCIRTTARVLIRFLIIFSFIDCDPGIRLSKSGVDRLRTRLVFGKANFFLGDILRAGLDGSDLLRLVHGSFTHHSSISRSPSGGNIHELALCSEGVCTFFKSLETPPEDLMEIVQIKVVSGQIYFRDHIYKKIIDLDLGGGQYKGKVLTTEREEQSEDMSCRMAQEYMSQHSRNPSHEPQLSLVAEEYVQDLGVAYRLTSASWRQDYCPITVSLGTVITQLFDAYAYAGSYMVRCMDKCGRGGVNGSERQVSQRTKTPRIRIMKESEVLEEGYGPTGFSVHQGDFSIIQCTTLGRICLLGLLDRFGGVILIPDPQCSGCIFRDYIPRFDASEFARKGDEHKRVPLMLWV